jgi:hypothetical protein
MDLVSIGANIAEYLYFIPKGDQYRQGEIQVAGFLPRSRNPDFA